MAIVRRNLGVVFAMGIVACGRGQPDMLALREAAQDVGDVVDADADGGFPSFDGTPPCATDCDCPSDRVCGPFRACVVSPRENMCCDNPLVCEHLGSCVQPDGGMKWCGVDGGPRDSGRDGGVVRDGGRDGGVIRDGGRDGGVIRDAGRDGGITDTGTIGACRTDCDCDPNLGCIMGRCTVVSRLNECCTSPICPPGRSCVNPDGSRDLCPFTETPIGAACQGQRDCGSIGMCIDEFPDGYCTQDCSRGGRPCPTGASCRSLDRASYCLDTCADSSECRNGYRCIALGTMHAERVCWPVPPGSTNPNGASVGSACAVDNECASGLTCIPDVGGQFPGGYCTLTFCDPATNPCPQGSSCYAFAQAFSMCLSDCPVAGTQSTCRANYTCFGPSGRPGMCVPQ